MSGGVDSSVSAYLLKQQGYDVVGIYAKTWTPEPGDGTECTWREDRRDALRVAAKLDIPFYTIDLETEYRRDVVAELVEGYRRGRTPNPDVLCNQRIKFAALWQAAQALGADRLATGHYAQIVATPRGPELGRGRDSDKDQSYFLWRIPAGHLPSVDFPIGGFLKHEVRSIARRAGLVVADKKDSQGICFLGPTNLRQFLSTQLPSRPGEILDSRSGDVVGTHDGTQFVTIGQRHQVGELEQRKPDMQAQYVTAIDPVANRVWVGPRVDLYQRAMELEELSWLDETIGHQFETTGTIECSVQVRYRQTALKAELRRTGSRLLLETRGPVFAPTPGQSAVLYHNDRVLGGGLIRRVIRRGTADKQIKYMVGSPI